MEATYATVLHELMYDEDRDDEGVLIAQTQLRTQEEAEALIAKHKAILDTGMRLGSYTYYVVNEILRAENDPIPLS